MRQAVPRRPRKIAGGLGRATFEQAQAEFIAAALQGHSVPVPISRLDAVKAAPARPTPKRPVNPRRR